MFLRISITHIPLYNLNPRIQLSGQKHKLSVDICGLQKDYGGCFVESVVKTRHLYYLSNAAGYRPEVHRLRRTMNSYFLSQSPWLGSSGAAWLGGSDRRSLASGRLCGMRTGSTLPGVWDPLFLTGGFRSTWFLCILSFQWFLSLKFSVELCMSIVKFRAQRASG